MKNHVAGRVVRYYLTSRRTDFEMLQYLNLRAEGHWQN